MKDELIKHISKVAGVDASTVIVEYPSDLSHGDYTTNIAFMISKDLKKNPKEVASEIVEKLNLENIENVETIEVAGAGFINFFLKKEFFVQSGAEIIRLADNFGTNNTLKNKVVLFEYTDPNPFKPFHIGHLMANTIGEVLSRLADFQGANVKRICYGGDVGLHVAKTIWGMQKSRAGFPQDGDNLSDKTKFLGDSYVSGNTAYENDETSQKEIKEINKKVFDIYNGKEVDQEIKIYYDKGRSWSLEHFEEIYKKLGTKFDQYLFESETLKIGTDIVLKNKDKIFEESDGAVVFKGEKYNLHTRVFLTSEGLPTYETKEIGLFYKKSEIFSPYDFSFVVTANEQNDYFKVLKKVFSILEPELADKFNHISHGLLRFKEGKMSSRKGNVITGESLIEEMEELALQKVSERDISDEEKKKVSEAVSVSAIKYSILKQSPGKDIIFDQEKSLSFDGDSGPYLQYSYVRSGAILNKAKQEGVELSFVMPEIWKLTDLEKNIHRFPDIVFRAWEEKSPQILSEFLINLCGLFNSFYASGQIVDKKDTNSGYKVLITSAFRQVLKNGLKIMAIQAPDRM